MNKQTKEDIVAGIQGGLVVGMMLVGFMVAYQFIWSLIGLPRERYATVVILLFSLLTLGGLLSWIKKS